MMIDKSSPIPIYHQIEEQIRQQIDADILQQGESIPAERLFAEKYGISRMTVRQALNNLVNDGYLYRQKGKGTFVSQKKLAQKLQGLTSFTEEMKERGFEPSNRLIHFEVIAAPARIAKEFALTEHAPVYEIKRVRLADGKPMAFETTYIPANLAKGLTEDIIQKSLYDFIENQLELTIYEAKQELEAAIASNEEIRYLEVENGAPVLHIRRISYLKDGTAFEIVKSAFRADRYKFTLSLKR